MTAVLMVLGTARCGSSVLGATLGGVPGAVNIGELKNLWSICLAREGFACGCGEPVATCPFWTAVIFAAGLADRSVEEMVRWENESVPVAAVRRGFQPASDSGYRAAMADMYDAVAAVSGARLVIDTSKWPPFAAAVGGNPRVDLTAAHIVRDPRGHVVSRHRGWHAEEGLDHPLDRAASARAVLSWSKGNLLAERLRRNAADRITRIRYEDFVADPATHVAELLRAANHPVEVPHIEGQTVQLGKQHALAGSRTAGSRGTTLRVDDDWQRFLAPWVQRTLYALGLPLTATYRYPAVTARR